MAPDERSRLQLADAAKRAFGDDAGITLMELLPPVGWADVATKQDIAAIERRLETVEREIRAQTWKLMTLIVAVQGIVVAAVRL